MGIEKEAKDVEKEYKGKKIKFVKKESEEVEDAVSDFIKQQIQTSILKKELDRIGMNVKTENNEDKDKGGSLEETEEKCSKEIDDKKKTRTKKDNEKSEGKAKSSESTE